MFFVIFSKIALKIADVVCSLQTFQLKSELAISEWWSTDVKYSGKCVYFYMNGCWRDFVWVPKCKLFVSFQIDVVSLYLIYLVQMTTSGLQIIYTKDEVAFVQNLVYYIERAYRTPDYAVWERGSSYNDNTPEIHAR